ncbi:MAG: hypothetical protein GXP42_17640, partial [Chloroflexi bacterium]|nr:hypothetical protein [Chloroflexota bacterium]
RRVGDGDELIGEIITGEHGAFDFGPLSPGNYTIDAIPPLGYGPSQPETPLSLVLILGNEFVIDFGFQPRPLNYMPLLMAD